MSNMATGKGLDVETVDNFSVSTQANGKLNLTVQITNIEDYQSCIGWLARLGQETGDFPQDGLAEAEGDTNAAPPEPVKPTNTNIEVAEPEKKARKPRQARSGTAEQVVPQNSDVPLVIAPALPVAATSIEQARTAMGMNAAPAAPAEFKVNPPEPLPADPPKPAPAPVAATPIDRDAPLVAACSAPELDTCAKTLKALIPILPPDIQALPLKEKAGWITAFARRVGARVPAFATKLRRHSDNPSDPEALNELATVVQHQAQTFCAERAMNE